MNFFNQQLLAIVPEIFVLAMASLILLAGVFKEHLKYLSYYLVLFTVAATLGLTLFVYYRLGLSEPITLFYQQFVFDRLAFVLKLFIYAVTFVVFLYSQPYNEDHHIPANEFYVLGLLSMLGMMLLVSAHNFLLLFLGMELMSLPIYAMTALQRGKERGVEAAMKYFVIGAIATGMLLYGMSLILAVTKSLDIATIAQFITPSMLSSNLLLVFGLVFLIAGIIFKLGAAPFHMWVPDVYDGAPTSATLFLSTAPKLAAFALLIRIVVEALPSLNIQWSEILIVVSILSMAIGNLAAIVQTNIKRLLAYSSISHMGYMTLGLLVANDQGYAAALFYIITYTIMTLGAFGLLAVIAKLGFEANEINDLAGLNDRNPWLALCMMAIMFSLAGVPPLVGFISKVGVIEVLIQAHLVWLAVVAILFAIIGAYYYIRVVKVMYFESAPHAPNVLYSLPLNALVGFNGILLLVLGILPGPLFALCHWVF